MERKGANSSRGEFLLSKLGIRLPETPETKPAGSIWQNLMTLQNSEPEPIASGDGNEDVLLPWANEELIAEVEENNTMIIAEQLLASMDQSQNIDHEEEIADFILQASPKTSQDVVTNNQNGQLDKLQQHTSTTLAHVTEQTTIASSESDCDNTDEDPDYDSHSDSSSSSNNSSASRSPNSSFAADSDNLAAENDNLAAESDNLAAELQQTKSRKRKANTAQWQRRKAKLLRNSGKAYKTLNKGVEVPQRQMGQPCGVKCRQTCTEKFTEDERLNIFDNYWALGNVTFQRNFIVQCMQKVTPMYRYPNQNEGKANRVNNNAFYFAKNGIKLRVCKKFFMCTLDISQRCICTVIEKTHEGFLSDDMRGKHDKHKTVAPEIREGVRAHISSIPKIESHYIRAHSEKNYIEGGKSIAQLYRDYKEECEKDGKPFANITMYSRIFNYEFNIAFFTPKKDQCQKCETYKNSNEEEKKLLENSFTLHLSEKRLSREEKENDKEKVCEDYIVACFDLQAALPTPRGDVSSFYYKSKLSTYNFTVCDLQDKGQGLVYCFMWHEGQGKRGAIEIATCLLKYLELKAGASTSQDLEIILYSDNCCGQQKNKYVIATLLYAVANFNIKTITHKYLVTGHTQNEGDSVHSVIERNIKKSLKSGPIYVPDQYTVLVRTAKKTGIPYKVFEFNHDSFIDVKHLAERTSGNFTKNADGETIKFNDLTVVKVDKSNLDNFFYKTSYEEVQYKSVNVKECRTRRVLDSFNNFELKRAYNESIPISKNKKKDLLSLIETKAIPSSYSHFYKSLRVDNTD